MWNFIIVLFTNYDKVEQACKLGTTREELLVCSFHLNSGNPTE
jgi:hypothetical protein